jgi:hypothetical protein
VDEGTGLIEKLYFDDNEVGYIEDSPAFESTVKKMMRTQRKRTERNGNASPPRPRTSSIATKLQVSSNGLTRHWFQFDRP